MKTREIKTDILFFLYAALLCLFWYQIFIWVDQVLAALFSAISALLAIVNLYYLFLHMLSYMKRKLIHTS